MLASLLLLVLCVALAVSLYQQQSEISELLNDRIDFRRQTAQLEESLIDLSALLGDQVEKVAALHERIEENVETVRRSADRPEQREMASELVARWKEYRRRWDQRPPISSADHDAAVLDAARELTTTADLCEKLHLKTVKEIETAANGHTLVLRELALGIGAVGLFGSLAGVGLGYVAAGRWQRTMHKLQVHIRRAAGKLGTTVPDIVVSGEGGMQEIDDQMRGLARRVEEVVEQLQQREIEVLRTEQLAAVGQLAAGVAHEIRNPLTSIKLLVQASREDEATPGMNAEDLEVVEREIRRMEGSLQTFLDFARPPKVERREVDLATIVDQTLDLTRGRAAKQQVAVRFLKPTQPVRFLVDPEQMRQVLLNLVLNALDAMPEGGMLTIELTCASDAIVQFEVRDTGPGISPSVEPRLFQPFQSEKETGVGLGLVISRRIVEDHGGTLTARNHTAGGACFTVSLPIQKMRSANALSVAG